MKKTRVFLIGIRDTSFEFGNGVHSKTACFPQGVHVDFTISCHNQDEQLMSVGSVKKCDGTCVDRTGLLTEFGGVPSSMGYDTRPIVRAVERHLARCRERKNRARERKAANTQIK